MTLYWIRETGEKNSFNQIKENYCEEKSRERERT